MTICSVRLGKVGLPLAIQLADWAKSIVDTRNAMSGVPIASSKVVKA